MRFIFYSMKEREKQWLIYKGDNGDGGGNGAVGGGGGGYGDGDGRREKNVWCSITMDIVYCVYWFHYL